MSQGASTLVCAGCGTAPERSEPYPFACRNAGDDDVDHVIVRVLDPGQVRFPAAGGRAEPFAAYRGLLHSYHRAINGGLADLELASLGRAYKQLQISFRQTRGDSIIEMMSSLAKLDETIHSSEPPAEPGNGESPGHGEREHAHRHLCISCGMP